MTGKIVVMQEDKIDLALGNIAKLLNKSCKIIYCSIYSNCLM